MLNAQSNDDILYAFYGEDSRLKGFKNASDSIIYKPQFGFFSPTLKFENVMAVSEHENSQKVDSYYLLRNGKKFGRDSLYIKDFSFACESEGYIIFQDYKTELLGMFNSKGEVAIPPEYNFISNVLNGYFIGLKGASKEFLHDKHEDRGCEHYKWKGGETLVVNTSNQIIVKDFNSNWDLNWNSAIKSDTIVNDPFRVNLKSEEGGYISAIDNKLEFEEFLNDFMKNLNEEKLKVICFEEVVIRKGKRQFLTKDNLIEQYGKEIISRLQSKGKSEYSSYINTESFSKGISILPTKLNNIKNEIYDNCGGIKRGEHPFYCLTINFIEIGKYKVQNQFFFMKLNEKFKLIKVHLYNE